MVTRRKPTVTPEDAKSPGKDASPARALSRTSGRSATLDGEQTASPPSPATKRTTRRSSRVAEHVETKPDVAEKKQENEPTTGESATGESVGSGDDTPGSPAKPRSKYYTPVEVDKRRKPAFARTDNECLQQYKAFKTVDEFLKELPSADRDKFLRGAIKASSMAVGCLDCGKSYTSSLGLLLHMKKCGDRPLERPTFNKVRDSNRGRYSVEGKRKAINFAELLENEFSWIGLSTQSKQECIQREFTNNPSYLIDGVGCVREGCKSRFNAAEGLISHLNECVTPRYYAYAKENKIDEFRLLDKVERGKLIREALNYSNEVPCIICRRAYSHHYGLMYHLERCGVDENNRPWKCYRCGFQTTVADSKRHLNECWEEELQQLDSIKKEQDAQRQVVGTLGEVNLRHGKALQRNDDMDCSGLEESMLQTSLDTDSFVLASGGKPTHGKRARRHRASVAAGCVPVNSSRTRVNQGKMRFKFRKLDTLTEAPNHADFNSYVSSVEKSRVEWVKGRVAEPWCERLANMESGEWTEDMECRSPYIAALRAKQSVGLRVVGLPEVDSKPLTARSLKMKKQEMDNKRRHQIVRDKTRQHRPPDVAPLSFAEQRMLRPEGESVVYLGGPIAAIELAPNSLGEGLECMAVLVYPSDESLTGRGDEWRSGEGWVQMWTVQRQTREEGFSPVARPWFLLRSLFGMVLCVRWCPRPRTSDDDKLLGFLALTTAEGVVLIYRLDTDCVPALEEGKQMPIYTPTPKMMLRQPPLKDDSVGEEGEMEEMEEGEEVIGRKKKRKEVECLEDPLPPPPLFNLRWNPLEGGARIAAVSGMGAVCVWNLNDTHEEAEKEQGEEEEQKQAEEETEKEKEKEQEGEREEEEEEERMDVDVKVERIVARAEDEFTKKKSCHWTECRLLLDLDWNSPAQEVAWCGTNELSISFREKMVRFVEVDSRDCFLEEGTTRTAGARVFSCPEIFPGVFTFQAEYFATGDSQMNGLCYISLDSNKEGYFVVPLGNRHELMTWSVAVSTRNGIVASTGADGIVIHSNNGHLAPYLSDVDYQFSTMHRVMMLDRNRTYPVDGVNDNAALIGEDGKKEKTRLADPLHTHQLAKQHMWLDVYLDRVNDIKRPRLETASMDLRIESLNAIAVTQHGSGDQLTVCGGQAGLLFFLPCRPGERRDY